MVEDTALKHSTVELKLSYLIGVEGYRIPQKVG